MKAPPLRLKRNIAFWTKRGIIRETGSDTFTLEEESAAAGSSGKISGCCGSDLALGSGLFISCSCFPTSKFIRAPRGRRVHGSRRRRTRRFFHTRILPKRHHQPSGHTGAKDRGGDF